MSAVSVFSVDEPRYRLNRRKKREIEKIRLFSYGLPYFIKILAAVPL